MIILEIHINDKGCYPPIYLFDRWFRLETLFGCNKKCKENCYGAIRSIKEDALKDANILFKSTANDFHFNIKKGNLPIAYSRYYPEKALMKRVLLILQNHIQKAVVTKYPSSERQAA